MVKEITEKDFDVEVLAKDGLVLVDFWAAWCGPCRMLSPILDKLSEVKSDSADFYKINVDENPAIAQKFNITSLPTVLVFEKGTVKNNLVGVRPSQVYEEMLS